MSLPARGRCRANLKDGLRILATRIRGRGLRKSLYHAWMANLGPSERNHGQKFTLRLIQQFGRRGSVALMCHREEKQTRCHRHLRAKMLAGKIG
jgi:hypothetical protein